MLYWTLVLLAGICIAATFLPLIPSAHGAFRVFDFPRLQLAIIIMLLLAGLGAIVAPTSGERILLSLLAAALILQCSYIIRFSPVWRRRSADFSGNTSDVPVLRLLISNVKQGNREYDHLVSLIKSVQPDIGLFMETDQDWSDALDEAVADYPYRIEHLLDNAYGMLLVSKFELKDGEVRFLLNQEVPSIDTMVVHPDGDQFRLFAVHPEPPLLHRDTFGRDAEIALVGKIVGEDDAPVVVSGDLNDVAWSRTTRRFLRISRLLDPREGRGLFNTFHAGYAFLRWPLDHIFHSPHFQLISMARMPFVNSDHFPMFYELALTEREIGRRRVDPVEPTDLKEADELIEIEKNRDRRPAGHDWEDG